MSRLPQGLPTASHYLRMGCALGAAAYTPHKISNHSEHMFGSKRRHAHHAWARDVRAALLRRRLPRELRELVLCFLAIPRWSLAAAVSEADGRPGELRIARGDGDAGEAGGCDDNETVERFETADHAHVVHERARSQRL